jgi:hypothetical protein
MKYKNLPVLRADLEFDSTISEAGMIEVPTPLSSLRGSRVKVRVRSLELAGLLQARGVTDEEISRIATLQAEAPESVVRFLLSEGVLRRRARGDS